MGKSQESFSKKEKEKKKRKKRQDKLDRKIQRKAEKEERGTLTFEEQIRYVDEDGNLSETPPDPSKKKKIKAENIVLGVPPVSNDPADYIRNGKVKFFNEEKGFGFILDDETRESIFVHINNLQGPIKENDKVTFETERGPKGLVAVNVVILG